MNDTIPSHVAAELVVDFDIYAPPGVEQGFHEAWAKLQADAPPGSDLVWTVQNGGHWIPVRGEALHSFFADNINFSSRYATVPRERAIQYTAKPQTLDLPRHRPFRNLLNPTFSPKNIRALEPKIRDLAIELIEAFRPDGACDFTTDFCAKLPIQVFMSLDDLPLADAPMLKRWTDQLARPDELTLEQIYANYTAYLQPYMEARKREPGTDLLSQLVNGRIDGEPVSDKDAMDLCTQVLFGGLDTVAALIGFVVHFLAQSQPHQAALRGDPALIPQAIEEFLRRFPIATPARVVAKDHVRRGAELREGDLVAMGTMVHGLDPAAFDAPFTVDFARPGAPLSTFGNGIHQCPGQLLARTELRITLEELLSRLPEFRLAPGEPIAMRGGQVGLITRLPLEWKVAAQQS